jgi:hypothetical protein
MLWRVTVFQGPHRSPGDVRLQAVARLENFFSPHINVNGMDETG